MNEERKTAEVEAVGDEDGRRQLWVRAGMAVGLIGLLLGGLAAAQAAQAAGGEGGDDRGGGHETGLCLSRGSPEPAYLPRPRNPCRPAAGETAHCPRIPVFLYARRG